jgi:2-polyprenyl-6-methoxyphenol hydroxylase-like FAD-dependent oxidoreductase
LHNPSLIQQALDAIGCAQPLVVLGDKTERLRVLEGNSYLTSTEFSLLAPYTQFPFSLVLPQTHTEGVLMKKLENLGITVSRPYKVISMTSSPTQEHTVDVQFESGEIVQASYVIGADGAKSVVCADCQLFFKSTEERRFVIKQASLLKIPTAIKPKTTALCLKW